MLAYKRKALKRAKNRKVRFSDAVSMDNLWAATSDARRGKNRHKGVRIFDTDPINNLNALHSDLISESFHSSRGIDVSQLCPCGKVRVLHKLPFYPDHIVHHALMRTIMPILDRYYYYDSSASIKGRGIHFAARRVKRYIDENRKSNSRLYYVKLDFVKFYHNIDQEKCFDALARLFTDPGIRYLIREVVTATESGLGIGLYPIQPFANFYLCAPIRDVMSRFDVRLFVYCDDIVFISNNKSEVWKAVNYFIDYANNILHQPLHTNIGMQIVDETHFLDFVGHRFYYGHTLLRSSIKKRFARSMAKLRDPIRRYQVATAYKGWCMHANCFNLWKFVMNMKSYSELQLPSFDKHDKDGNVILDGQKVSAAILVNQSLVFTDISTFDSKLQSGKRSAYIQVTAHDIKYKFCTANQQLIDKLTYCKDNNLLPFQGTLYNRAASGMPDYDIR